MILNSKSSLGNSSRNCSQRTDTTSTRDEVAQEISKESSCQTSPRSGLTNWRKSSRRTLTSLHKLIATLSVCKWPKTKFKLAMLATLPGNPLSWKPLVPWLEAISSIQISCNAWQQVPPEWASTPHQLLPETWNTTIPLTAVKSSTMAAWVWATTAPWTNLTLETTATQCYTMLTQTRSSDQPTPQLATNQPLPPNKMHNRKRTSKTSLSRCNSKALEEVRVWSFQSDILNSLDTYFYYYLNEWNVH